MGQRGAKLVDLDFAPGVVTNTTDRDASGRWTDSNLVRWHKGSAEKVGGSVRQLLTGANGGVYLGAARTILDWSSLDGQRWIAIGTQAKLYLVNNGRLYDITPIRKVTTTGVDPITTVDGESLVTILDPDHRAEPGDFVNLFSASAVGGLILSGTYQIVEVLGPDSYTIDAGIDASSSATGGGTITIEYEIAAGFTMNARRCGVGTGPVGEGTVGTPRAGCGIGGVGGDGVSGIPVRLRTWSLEQWGEDLVANPSGGGLYWWDRTSGPGTRAVIRPNAPSAIQRILVNPENRFLVALGATGLDGVPDPMRVRWPVQENFDVWQPTQGNSAGGKRLDYGSRLVTGLRSRSQIFIWSDTHLYAMEFVGPSLYFGFQPLGTCKIVGPNAAVDVGGVIYFMAFDDLMVFDGTLRVLDCEVWTKVFGDPANNVAGDFDRTQAEMVHCSHYSVKNEVRWDYRSVGGTDCDRCVIYNYRENCCYYHVHSRTAYSNVSEVLTGSVTNPYALNDGKLYKQEAGLDDVDDEEVTVPAWYLQSYDNHIGGSDAIVLINAVTPNFDRISGNMNLLLKAKVYPREPAYRTKGPYLITPNTYDVGVRAKGSQIALRLESAGGEGEDFRMGKWQVLATPYGGRSGANRATAGGVVVFEAGDPGGSAVPGYSFESVGTLVSTTLPLFMRAAGYIVFEGGSGVFALYLALEEDGGDPGAEVYTQVSFTDNTDTVQTFLFADATVYTDYSPDAPGVRTWQWPSLLPDFEYGFTDGEQYTLTFS